MAYFQNNRQYTDPQQDPRVSPEEYSMESYGESLSDEPDYDDGFDELLDPETEDEEDGEMDPEQVRSRFRFAMGAGNLVSVIVGTAAFLILLTLLLSMINFLNTDLSRNLTLFQTKF